MSTQNFVRDITPRDGEGSVDLIVDKIEDRALAASKRKAAVSRLYDTAAFLRKVRDSNPRYGKPYSGFRVRPIRSLWQLSLSFLSECECKSSRFLSNAQGK